MWIRPRRYLLLGALWIMFFTFLLHLKIHKLNCDLPSTSNFMVSHHHSHELSKENYTELNANMLKHIDDNPHWGPHKMAVIIPFRDCFEELLEFAPYMHEFLNKNKIRHSIYVINQIDNFRFNRGSLINVGFQESRKECDYIGMHDVDLIPVNPNINYPYPENGPYHVSSPELHPRNHYSSFVGGILLLRNEHFSAVNGFSNRYWGWGSEDDDFGIRMRNSRLKIQRPIGIKTGNRTFRHIHDDRKRIRDDKKYFNQNKQRPSYRSGLKDLRYKIDSERRLTIDGAVVRLLNVKLICDFKDTPWCVKPEEHQLYINKSLLPKIT